MTDRPLITNDLRPPALPPKKLSRAIPALQPLFLVALYGDLYKTMYSSSRGLVFTAYETVYYYYNVWPNKPLLLYGTIIIVYY